MSEFSELAEGAHEGEEAVGVAKTAMEATGGIVDAAEGDWDGAADGFLHMSESAVGVATGGISEVVEMGWDKIAEQTGLPTAHEALSEATQAAGDTLSDGMLAVVGGEQSYQAAMDFDDGDILGGLGHMAEGAGETLLAGAEDLGGELVDGAENLGSEIVDGAENLGGELVDGVESVGSDIADGAESLGSDIADEASELWDDITG